MRGDCRVGKHVVKAAKALIVSEPIVIFYIGHGKSLLV